LAGAHSSLILAKLNTPHIAALGIHGVSVSDKVPCKECNALVLPSTAERTGGLCMPCKNGTRKSMEQAKENAIKERELDKTCPFRAYWRKLVDRVYDEKQGFTTLTEEEKLYYSVCVLIGEVYNGGFVQFFDNSSGAQYRYAELGLIRMEARASLKLLREAKNSLFGKQSVPTDQAQRWEIIRKLTDEPDLDSLDTEFYKDTDKLDEKTEKFAVEHGLVKYA